MPPKPNAGPMDRNVDEKVKITADNFVIHTKTRFRNKKQMATIQVKIVVRSRVIEVKGSALKVLLLKQSFR